MLVPANSLRASVCRRVFTHFKHEQDAAMTSGKLDEELARMSRVADHLRAVSMVLFDQSFASTNEREGSQIARDIVETLLDSGITVVMMIHLFDLAHSLHTHHPEEAVFLRASREADGRRTFTLHPGEPEPTSYGSDLLREIFGGVPIDAAGGVS